MSILLSVQKLGQQIWLDNLSRSLVQSGELAQFCKRRERRNVQSRHFPKAFQAMNCICPKLNL